MLNFDKTVVISDYGDSRLLLVCITKIMRSLLLTLVACSLSPAFACTTDTAPCRIDKKAWVDLFSAALPAALCKENSPIMRCYSVSQAKCIDISLTVTKQCIQSIKIPDFLDKGDSKKFGEIIGGCAGDKLTNQIPLKKGIPADCTAKY